MKVRPSAATGAIHSNTHDFTSHDCISAPVKVYGPIFAVPPSSGAMTTARTAQISPASITAIVNVVNRLAQTLARITRCT
jgi:hypothetical protein